MCFTATGIGNDLAISHSRTSRAETVRAVESVELTCILRSSRSHLLLTVALWFALPANE